ncbi:hypothetical protein ACFL4W_00005 [Planctomycetota bacterium]
MADKKKDDKETDAEKDKSEDQAETTPMDTARDPKAEGKKKDSQETSFNDAVSGQEREPWSVLDLPRAFACAGNGSAMVASALLIFVILIAATIPWYIGIVFNKSYTYYIFGGLTALILIGGLSAVLGTLAKVHGAILTGSKRMSTADTMGYFLRHGLDLILSPIQVIVITALVAGAEVGLFYLAKIPFVYGVLFVPLVLLTLVLLAMGLILFIFITLSAPAVAIGGFHGRGAFEKARRFLKKKPVRVAGYTLVNAIIAGIVGLIFYGILLAVQVTMHAFFVGNILGGAAGEYYAGASRFLIPGVGAGVNIAKSVTMLVSGYITVAVFFAYSISLYSALNTIEYLALDEEQAEV